MTTIPPEARTLFESLCDGADDVDLDGLRLRVHQHLDEVRRAAERDELLPIDVAEALAGALERLLKEAAGEKGLAAAGRRSNSIARIGAVIWGQRGRCWTRSRSSSPADGVQHAGAGLHSCVRALGR